MRTVIIEDEQPAARRLAKLLCELESSAVVLATLDSVEAASAWFAENTSFDTAPELAFMDIRLSDGLSFEIFQRVRVPCPVVFTTAYDEYSLRAFRVHSVDYLLKPIKADDLQRGVEKFKQLRALYESRTDDASTLNAHVELIVKDLLRQDRSRSEPVYKSRFLVQRRDQLVTVPVEEIAYFYSEYKLTHLVTHAGAAHVIEQSLEEIETQMNPHDFFRANRQCIVNARAIVSIAAFFNGKLTLTLMPPMKAVQQIVVSREKATALKQWLNR